MHIISMIFLLVLFLLFGSSLMESVPTFEVSNPYNGETLTCDKCPPGTHMTAQCTATTPTQCAQCRKDQFTELWNYLPRCLYCDNFCTENQEVERECSTVRNRVCRCKEGFYWAADFCLKHKECAPGEGVQTRGTSQTNTVCETCPEGYFSNSSSALETCVKHRECASGQIVLFAGTIYQDTLCGSLEGLTYGDETHRTFLIRFFDTHRFRLSKLRKFVARFIDQPVPRQREPLLQRVSAWLAQAPREELRKLPQFLRASQLHSLADKLERRLLDIQQQNPGSGLIL